MRYMICIALVMLPAGLARTLGYWFELPQALSQAISLLLIDGSLIVLIVFDKCWCLSPRPYFVTLMAYILIETGWIAIRCPV